VRVAVIDSGVDVDHPDLAGRVAGRSDFVGRRDAASVRGDRHGTAVAGVIAAVAHNNLGIVGIAPEVRLLALQACWEQEADDAAVCNTFTLAQALAAAIEARADVVNLSLAGPHDALLARLVRRGQQAGIIFVGAAHGDPAAARGFPLDVEGVIGVVAAESAAADESLIAAPGEDIFTLAPAGAYNAVSGSSMAAAQVSAMVALLRAHDPKLSAARAAALLSGSQRPFETAGGTRQAIHACRAIAALSPGLDCDQPALRQAIRGTNRRH
jgi:subtilisin family serine protease